VVSMGQWLSLPMIVVGGWLLWLTRKSHRDFLQSSALATSNPPERGRR